MALSRALARPAAHRVFRRFHIAEHVAIGRVLTRYLAPYGHVFTLSDRRLHLHWTVRIPLFLGQLSFVHFRPRKINDAGRLRALSVPLAQRVRLNVNWLVSDRKLFAFRTSDEYWRTCVGVLLDRADLAPIAISEPSEFLLWEIAAFLDCVPDQTIFIVADEKYAAAVSRFSSEDRLVGAAIPPRMSQWVLARALAEPDPVRQAKLGSLYKEMIRSQRGDDCSTLLGFGTLSDSAAACSSPK